jgi:uncharacterized protein YciI
MFFVNLRYIKPLDLVDRHLAEHKEFLREQYAKGIFILSGRKVPRTGGVILARAKSRQGLTEILEMDPFVRDGIADYEITQFTPESGCRGACPLME